LLDTGYPLLSSSRLSSWRAWSRTGQSGGGRLYRGLAGRAIHGAAAKRPGGLLCRWRARGPARRPGLLPPQPGPAKPLAVPTAVSDEGI
jgi:hypothetical protein